MLLYDQQSTLYGVQELSFQALSGPNRTRQVRAACMYWGEQSSRILMRKNHFEWILPAFLRPSCAICKTMTRDQ
jgi:hypothetical protein